MGGYKLPQVEVGIFEKFDIPGTFRADFEM
jgi:hypothetical protein